MEFSNSRFMGVKFVGAVGQNPLAKYENLKVCKKPYDGLRIESSFKYSEFDI